MPSALAENWNGYNLQQAASNPNYNSGYKVDYGAKYPATTPTFGYLKKAVQEGAMPASTFQSSQNNVRQNPTLESKMSGYAEIGNSQVYTQVRQPQTGNAIVQHTIMPENTQQITEQPTKDGSFWHFPEFVVTLIVIGMIISLLIVHSRRSQTKEIRNFVEDRRTIDVSRTYTTREGNDTIQTEVIETRTSLDGWNEEVWNTAKTGFPNDWKNMLKWISNHIEDVNFIIWTSETNAEAKTRILRKAYEELHRGIEEGKDSDLR